jgi:hypothetical protein
MLIEELHSEGVAFAKHSLENFGAVNTTFLALTQDKKLLLVGAPDFARDRDGHHHYLRKAFRGHGVIAYSVCSEVWMAKCAPGALPQRAPDGRLITTSEPPSQNPERTEAVVVSTVGNDQVITAIFAIDRSRQPAVLGTETLHTTSAATLENQVGLTCLLTATGTTATHDKAPTSLSKHASAEQHGAFGGNAGRPARYRSG